MPRWLEIKTMKTLKSILLIATLIGSFAVVGCKEKGPMEKAGESIDKAAQDAGDAAKDAGEKTKDAAEKAKEDVKDAVNK